MRYTEVRMAKMASELLADLDKDTVDFVNNYDDTLTMPEVLPTRVPNLLVNGSSVSLLVWPQIFHRTSHRGNQRLSADVGTTGNYRG